MEKTTWGKRLKTPTFLSIALLSAISALSLTGCTGSSNGSSTNTNAPVNLTIDNAGVIPVFANSSTTTVVYVHNNSAHAINGINYSFTNGSSELNASVDGSSCTTIPAHGSCPLTIKTPVLSGSNQQGSITIKANYLSAGIATSFTQLVNYAQITSSQTNGAVFQSGTNISSYGNSTGYATIYVYGSGHNQIYDITSLNLNKPSLAISNGNISGQQIQSNFVQAIEVSSPIANSLIDGTITINSKLAGTSHATRTKSNSTQLQTQTLSVATNGQFSSSVNIGVNPSSSGAILVASTIPYIDTSTTTSGQMIIQNSGNQVATISTATPSTGITLGSGCQGESLAPGTACTLNFSVAQGNNGSGSISVDYTGGNMSNNIVGNVQWFNGVGNALVSIQIANSPLNFAATTPGSTLVTMTNIGGYNLTNASIPAPVILSGSATATVTNDTCSGESLPIGLSCSYTLTLNDSVTDLYKQVNLGFSADYNNGSSQTYSRIIPLGYSSQANGAVMTMTPSTSSLSITGNNIESQVVVLTLTNSGNQPANLSIVGLDESAPAFLTASSSQTATCGSSLNASASCEINIKLGPVLSANPQSGSDTYTVNYTAAGQSTSGTLVTTLNWTVQSYAQSISLMSSSSNLTGAGTTVSPYEFTGADAQGKYIILTYKNTGTHTTKITGIQDNNTPLAWLISTADSTCIVGTQLTTNQECTIQYNNQLLTNSPLLGSSGSTFAIPLEVPSLVYQDPSNPANQFEAQPELPQGTTVSATANQATIANSVTLTNSDTTITISSLLANAYNSSVVVTSKMEDYATESNPTVGSCANSVTSGINTQTCTLNAGNPQGTVVYTINSSLLSDNPLMLTVLFSTPTAGSSLYALNPIENTLDLGVRPPLIFVTTDTYYGSSLINTANTSNPPPATPFTDGLDAADFLCNQQAVINNHPGTYKALLGTAARQPSAPGWIMLPNTVYQNADGLAIGTTDNDGKLPANLTNAIGSNNTIVWTGFKEDWTFSNDNCMDWSSLTAQGNGTIGTANATQYSIPYMGSNSGYLMSVEEDMATNKGCYNNLAALYCVGQ